MKTIRQYIVAVLIMLTGAAFGQQVTTTCHVNGNTITCTDNSADIAAGRAMGQALGAGIGRGISALRHHREHPMKDIQKAQKRAAKSNKEWCMAQIGTAAGVPAWCDQ